MVLTQKRFDCLLWAGEELLVQVEEFKYPVSRFMSGERLEWENARGIGAADAVAVVLKRKLSVKVKLLIYWSIYFPSLTYGHKLWLVTERMRSQIQAAEMSFLPKVSVAFPQMG